MRILILIALLFSTSTASGQVSMPDPPDIRDQRKEILDELKVDGYIVALATTVVADLLDKGIAVLYGSIFLKSDRSATFLFENKEVDLRCFGTSAKGVNETTCTFEGEVVSKTRHEVAKDVYKTPDGFVVNPIETIDGQSFGKSYTKWGLFSFPKAEPILEILKQEKVSE